MAVSLSVLTLLRLPLTPGGPSVSSFTAHIVEMPFFDPVLFFSIVVNGAILAYILFFLLRKTPIPFVGFPHWLPLSSYYGGARFFFDSQGMLQEGYQKYKSRIFKVPQWSNWLLIVSGDKLVDELHRIPDDTLSLLHSARDELQIPYTMGSSIHTNPYHLPILRTKLTRHLDLLVTDILDELLPAFDNTIGNKCSESWTTYSTLEVCTSIITRTFNRILVGKALCRDEVYNNLSRQFAIKTLISATVINFFPKVLHPMVGRMASAFPSILHKAMVHLAPIIEQRKLFSREYGNDSLEKPVDILEWLMDAAEGPELATEALATRILVVNAATIQTSSMTFTQALTDLAVHSEYLGPLRSEAEAALRTYGWNKAAMNELPLLDSFFKESMRMNSLGSMGFPRKALKAFTFSDGTRVSEGSYVSAAFAVHHDEEYYDSPEVFNGFRFLKDGMVKTSSRFLSFGHGKHACPGRFVVSYLLKALMAHILVNYDVKLVGNGERPANMWLGYACSPNRSAKILFRQRRN